VADGSVDLDAQSRPKGDMDLGESSGSSLSDIPIWQIALFGVAALFIFWPLIGRPIKNTLGRIVDGSNKNGDDEVSVEIELPEGIDSLVKSGDVKAPLVTPRTLEIRPNGVASATTFIVVPVEVEEADWPCPTKKFKGQPAACWVFGTVVNYLVGIPNDAGSAAVFEDLQQSGGSVQMRMSTEKVMRFTVDRVQQIERHQTEALGQHHFGLTLVGLGGDGAQRYVAQASYVPQELAFSDQVPEGWAAPEGSLASEEEHQQPTTESQDDEEAASLHATLSPTAEAERVEASPAPSEGRREETAATVEVWASPTPAGIEREDDVPETPPTATTVPHVSSEEDETPDVTHSVTLGERVELSDRVSIVPVGLKSEGDGSLLTVRLENRGSLPYTPSWAVRAETADGEVVTNGITQEGDRVTIKASAPASVWIIKTSKQLIQVHTQTGGGSSWSAR
jgi:hypothetical protein